MLSPEWETEGKSIVLVQKMGKQQELLILGKRRIPLPV